MSCQLVRLVALLWCGWAFPTTSFRGPAPVLRAWRGVRDFQEGFLLQSTSTSNDILNPYLAKTFVVSGSGHELQIHGSFNLTELEVQIAKETWNWCSKFVVPHNLCPWAAASVREGPLQMYLVRNPRRLESMEQRYEDALQAVTGCFLQQLSTSMDPNKAISFVVQCPTPGFSSDWGFQDFYDWYLRAEEDMLDLELNDEQLGGALLSDVVTWAPFHPHWRYSETNEDNDPLALEKQAPHPTVSIVSTQVVDRAGQSATRQIAESNAGILFAKSLDEWKRIYRSAVFLS